MDRKSLSTVTSPETERRVGHIHLSSSRIPSAQGGSVCEQEWMRRRHHLLQQVPSKHLSLLQRRETEEEEEDIW